MSITKTAVVGFELGVIKGFENVRSAHIQYVYNLVKYLNGLGHTTHIITNKLRDNTFFPEDISHIPLKFIPDPRKRKSDFVHISGHSKKLSIYRLLTSIGSILRLAYKEKYTYIHFANGGLGVGTYAFICACLAPSKCSVSWSPSSAPSKRSIPWRLMSLGLKKLRCIICSTEYHAERLREYGLSPTVIKYGPSRDIFINPSSAKKRVTFWRDPSYTNGADIALASFMQLSKEFPKIIFTMMFRPHFDSIQIPMELPKNLEIYHYPYPTTISLELVLSESLACVFPFRSLCANPQLCVLETVSAGIPCITSNVQSLPEYIIDKTFLLEKINSQELSKKIRSFLSGKIQNVPTHPKSNGYSWTEFEKQYSLIFNNNTNQKDFQL